MSSSVFNHPVLSGLFARGDIGALFEFDAELTAMLRFEAALAHAQVATGIMDTVIADEIAAACDSLSADIPALRAATITDGVVVPELIRQIKKGLSEDACQFIHFGATSQDVIDTALVLRLKDVVEILTQDIASLLDALKNINTRFGAGKIFARTRLQQAYEVPVSHRIDAWIRPLQRLQSKMHQIKDELLVVQLGGGGGDLVKLGDKGPQVRQKLAEKLGLKDPECCWHTDRLAITGFATWLAQLTTCLGKIGSDISFMAINEISEVRMTGGGGSSAMPHKQNPVKSELLMTLAYFNDSQLSAMQTSALQEFERSGSRWSLEWMVLPQMVMASGAALKLACDCVGNIQGIGEV